MDSSAAPRVPSARGTGLWFVASGTHLKGPFTFEELVVELDMGRVSAGDFCWRQGFQEWRPVCAVDEFGISRDKPTLLSPYPSVPLPSTGRVGRRSTDRLSNPLSYAQEVRPRIIEEHRIVRLRVQKNQKSTVTWLERLGLFFFSVILAYASVWVVSSEVEKNFEQRMFIYRLGSLEHLGDPNLENQALDAAFVEPLFSAPGYLLNTDTVPVRLSGRLEKSGVMYSVNDWRIEGPRPLLEWSPKKMGIDSIYLEQYSVLGESDPAYPGIIHFSYEGEPNTFVSQH